MATASIPSSAAPPNGSPPPRLENGDRLTREEFERRYEAQPDLKKAELIDGVVYMPSPVRHRRHGKPHFDMIGWLGRYTAATPGVEGGHNSSLRLDLNSEPQPDAFLIIMPECGGHVVINEEDYIVGAPEWVGEVAASRVSYDLHVKLEAYRRNGVKEYVVWRVEDRGIDWFVLRGGHFEALPAGGVFHSTVFPGLWLDSQALIAGDLARVAQVLDQGVAQPEHSAYVQTLQQRRQT
jgi:Uma2 family endonuclease